ncbi:MAG: hypothetical protein ACJ75I_09650 [Solirubrobacterales bacterium]
MAQLEDLLTECSAERLWLEAELIALDRRLGRPQEVLEAPAEELTATFEARRAELRREYAHLGELSRRLRLRYEELRGMRPRERESSI